MIKIRHESLTAPTHIQELITRFGGLNRFGQPNFRVVWSDTRLDWDGPEFTPKYFNVPHRWIIESWVAPETYGSPEMWEAVTQGQLGPYPSRGDYELSFIVQTPSEDFLPLTGPVVEQLILMVKLSRNVKPKENRAAKYDAHTKKHEDYKKWAFDSLTPDASWITPSGKSVIPHSYPYEKAEKLGEKHV